MNKNSKIFKLCSCSFIVAIAFVLSKIQFFQLPFGGSITLFVMLIISLPGYFFGLKYGLIAASAFAILKCIFASYTVNIAQVIFDYFLSYAVFGITGFSYKKDIKNFILFYLIAAVLRFIFACISGCVFFSEYCPEGMNLLLYVIIYNGCYIFAEVLLSLIVLFISPIKKLLIKVCQKYE